MTAPLATQILAATPANIERAAAVLRAGGLIAFPTETVYGLGADATDDRAVARIFEAKSRPHFNPLICHFPEITAAAAAVRFDSRARALAEAFWPGPLTLVLPRAADCPASLLCSTGLDSLAVRVPDQTLAHDLLRAAGRPLAAPSANRSGRVSPTTAAHVATELGGRIELILDGGPCRIGLESTVISLLGEQPLLLRPGGLPVEALAEVLGELPAAPTEDTPLASPGMLVSHYAPERPLRLDACESVPGEALLAFGPEIPAGADAEINLSPSGDLQEAAAKLFAALRSLDRPDVTGIAVMPIPERGLGRAINDRLRRAAAPRPAAGVS